MADQLKPWGSMVVSAFDLRDPSSSAKYEDNTLIEEESHPTEIAEGTQAKDRLRIDRIGILPELRSRFMTKYSSKDGVVGYIKKQLGEYKCIR